MFNPMTVRIVDGLVLTKRHAMLVDAAMTINIPSQSFAFTQKVSNDIVDSHRAHLFTPQSQYINV